MRFTILQDRIEYCNTKGRVIRFPNSVHNIKTLWNIIEYYNLNKQDFGDRAIFTESYV